MEYCSPGSLCTAETEGGKKAEPATTKSEGSSDQLGKQHFAEKQIHQAQKASDREVWVAVSEVAVLRYKHLNLHFSLTLI